MEKVPNNTQRTRIGIKKATRDRLAKYGSITSTWDSLICEILDHLEYCDRFWEDRT